MSVTAAHAAGEGASCADSPGAKPSQQTTDAWAKIAKALELHEALQASTQGDVRIVALAEKLEAFQDQNGEVLESCREFIDSKVQQARQELTLKEQSELATAMAEAQSHLTALVGKAGGKTDG